MAQHDSNVSAVARHLLLSPARIRELEAEGIFQRLNGKLDLDECRHRYIDHLRQRRPRSPADEKWREERARQLALQNAVKARELIPFTEANEGLETVIGLVLAELYGMGARVSRDLEVRRRIDEDIVAVRRRITNKLSELTNALHDGFDQKNRR
jgi:hypothetical protein